MTNKKILIIKQLAVFLCGIVLSVGEVTQPESAIPETAGGLESRRNFPFTLYNPSGKEFTVNLPEEEVSVGWLKREMMEQFHQNFWKDPQSAQDPRYLEIHIMRGGEILQNAMRVKNLPPLDFCTSRLLKINCPNSWSNSFIHSINLAIVGTDLFRTLAIDAPIYEMGYASLKAIQRMYDSADQERQFEIERAIQETIVELPGGMGMLNEIISSFPAKVIPEIPTDKAQRNLGKCCGDFVVRFVQKGKDLHHMGTFGFGIKFEISDAGVLGVESLERLPYDG